MVRPAAGLARSVVSRPISPYFLLIIRTTFAVCSASTSVAVAGTAGPVWLPRTVHGATRTAPSRRSRLILPAEALDQA